MKLVAIATIGLGLLCANTYAAESQTTTTAVQTTTSIDQNTFLKQNKKNKGVVTLPSGLEYKIIKQGTGPKPKDSDIVTVNYSGTLVNGTEFDSSYKRNEPASFPVGGVIAGWTEALKLMPVGSTWMLYIPSDLAYGEQGSPPAIPANATLIFKVELLEIKK